MNITHPCYVLHFQVAFVTEVKLCISILDYKHIFQSYTEVSILVITRFLNMKWQKGRWKYSSSQSQYD